MSKKSICFSAIAILTAVMSCLLLIIPGMKSFASTPGISGGNGTAQNPYVIVSAEGLREIANHPDANFLLGADLDLGGSVWSPLCSESAPFTGSLNGCFHTVSNLTLKSSGSTDGIFAAIGKSGTVKNLGVETAVIKSKAKNIGSICGENYGTILRCYNMADVYCSNGDADVGAIAGENNGTVLNCYNTGKVSGTLAANVGGICGRNSNELLCCYNVGKLSGSYIMGGITGAGDSTLSHFIYQKNISASGDGVDTLAGESSLQLKDEKSYLGWDFTNVWAIDSDTNAGYPHLRKASDDNRLKKLSINPGTLTPLFDSSNLYYNAIVPSDTEYISVSAEAENSTAKVLINGAGSGENIPLASGENTIEVAVAAESGEQRVYTVIVTRSVSADTYLSSLNISGVDLTPAFDKNTFTYTGKVSSGTKAVRVNAAPEDKTSIVMVNGEDNQFVNLTYGENKIEISVTAMDGTEKIYTATLTRVKATDNYLSSLGVEGAEISPHFDKDTMIYSAAVDAENQFAAIFAETEDENAVVLYNGQSDNRIALESGINKIDVSVTAEDGSERVYTINITRKQSGENRLASLSVDGTNLSQSFDSNVLEYSCTVENSMTEAVINAAAIDSSASVTYNGVVSGMVDLGVGNNQINIRVVAEDGSECIYTINITRKKSAEYHLASLSIDGAALSPAFDCNVTQYDCFVDSAKTEAVINALCIDKNAAVKINGESSNIVPLSYGVNKIVIVVTAEDGGNKNYFLTVYRALSDNCNLSELSLSEGKLSPDFSPQITDYNVAVDPETTELYISAATEDKFAAVTVNGTDEKTVTLVPGSNTIYIKVTAQSGKTKTYTVRVERNEQSRLSLSILSLTGCDISPSFSPQCYEYSAVVPHGTTSVKINAKAYDGSCKLSFDTDNGSATKTLAVGENSVKITVSDTDGKQKVYTIKIIRQDISKPLLSALSFENGSLSPAFSPNTSDYTLEIPVGNSIKLTPTAYAADTNITVDGKSCSSGRAFLIDSIFDGKVINIKLTAGDGGTSSYNVRIKIKEEVSADLAGLAVNIGALSPCFSPDVTDYTVKLSSFYSSIKITPVGANDKESIKINAADVTSGEQVSCDLLAGETEIAVAVKSGNTTKVYYITVSNDSAVQQSGLKTLMFSMGALSPAFSPTISSYSMTVENDVSSIAVLAQTVNDDAAISINSSTAKTVSLMPGKNTVKITVTEPNGKISVYEVAVFRKFKLSETISYTDSAGAYKAEIPDSILSASSGDGYCLKLGDSKLTFDAATLSSYKGDLPLEVSLRRLSENQLRNESSKLAGDRSVIFGEDIVLSGGRCTEGSCIDAQVETELSAEFKAAAKYGVPCVYYYESKTDSLKRIDADFLLSSGLLKFNAEKSGRYVFAVILTEPKIDYTLTVDKNYTVTASGKSFECFLRKSIDSLRADNLSVVVKTTLAEGSTEVQVLKLSGYDEDLRFNLCSDASGSEVYLIAGDYGSGNCTTLKKSHFVS